MRTSVYGSASGTNILINGGFEVKQRTASTFTTNNIYTLDMWKINSITSTHSVSQITSTIGSPGSSIQIAYTHASSGSSVTYQLIENYLEYRGQTITFSASIKSNVSGVCYLLVTDGVNTSYSPAYTGAGTHNRLSITHNVASTATTLYVGITVHTSTQTVEVNDAMLNLGGIASPYVPIPVSDTIAKCQRYFEFVRTEFQGYSTNGSTQIATQVPFKVTKYIVPTVTRVGANFNLINLSGQPSTQRNTVDGIMVFGTATANGIAGWWPSNVTDGFIAEAGL